MSEKNAVSLVWISGSKVLGHEKADELARMGSKAYFMGPELTLGNQAILMRGTEAQKCMGKFSQAKEFLENFQQNNDIQ